MTPKTSCSALISVASNPPKGPVAPENMTKSLATAPWFTSVTVIVEQETSTPDKCPAGVVPLIPRFTPNNVLPDMDE